MVADPGDDLCEPCLSWGFAMVRTACCLCGRAGEPALMSGQHRPEPAISGPLCQIRAKVLRPGSWPGSRSGPCGPLRSPRGSAPFRCPPSPGQRGQNSVLIDPGDVSDAEPQQAATDRHDCRGQPRQILSRVWHMRESADQLICWAKFTMPPPVPEQTPCARYVLLPDTADQV